MKITINKPDNQVLVDAAARPISCAALPAYISVVQWDSTPNTGWIEFVNDGFGVFLPNQKIVDFTPFQYLVDAYNAWTAPPDPVPNAS